jgi:hypothetical protein
MEKIIIISEGQAEDVLQNPYAILSETGFEFNGFNGGCVTDVDVPEVTPTDDQDFFDEEAHEIVQVRIPDFTYDPYDENPYVMQAWADTNICPLEIEEYRSKFPAHEYRVVEVTDEIEYVEDVVNSPEAENISAEDEIDNLKSQVVALEAELAKANQFLSGKV